MSFMKSIMKGEYRCRSVAVIVFYSIHVCFPPIGCNDKHISLKCTVGV